ncbi:MAG: ABC transporter ATP-binding protein/permease [Verrucomicrobiales bacterium]
MPALKVQMIRDTARRFREALRMLARSPQGSSAKRFALLLLVLMLAVNGLNVINSYVGRDFMSSIENSNPDAFLRYALIYVGVFAGSTLVGVFYRFCEERIGLLWREQLTWDFAKAYVEDRTYYRLDSSGGIRNPDQRITDDVRAFTTTSLSFTLLLINGTVTALSFSGVLWSISPLLFTVAVVYAICGSAITILYGRPLIRLNYNQLDMEANFRADLIHIRENSESIALAHREGRFSKRLDKHLRELAGNYRRIIGVNRNLGFFTTGYNYLIQIIPALIVAPLFMRGDFEFGVITQSAMAFGTLLGAFSIIVTQFQSISAFAAVTARLFVLREGMEKARHEEKCAILNEESPDTIRFEKVTLRSADGSRLLVQDLNVVFQAGSRWVITGPEDAPKVALFRAAASIWDCGEGRILRPSLEETLFLPERPYLPPGCLREILVRTNMENIVPDEEIMAVLQRLELGELVARVGGLGSDQDWDDLLSIGEQHMLSVARILLARPAFVFLDRPGSSLPKSQIAAVLELFRERSIGCIVLAKNGESQLRYDHALDLNGDGHWSVRQKLKRDTEEQLADVGC